MATLKNTNTSTNINNETVLSCSSSSGSSSTNLNTSVANNDPNETTSHAQNELAFSTRLSQSWTIPNDEPMRQHSEHDSVSNRATVNTNPSTPTAKPNKITSEREKDEGDDTFPPNVHMNKYGQGGIAFDFILDDKHSTNTTSTSGSQYLNLQNLRLLNATKTKPVLRSSVSTALTLNKSSVVSDSTGTSTGTLLSSSRSGDNNTQLTLTKRYEMASNGTTGRTERRLSSSTTDECSPLPSAKTNSSLGARIQAKAAENNSSNGNKPGLRRLKSSAEYSSPTNMNGNTTLSLPTNTSVAPLSAGSSNAGAYMNRALQLRQQSAKAKRESLDNPKSANALNTTASLAPGLGNAPKKINFLIFVFELALLFVRKIMHSISIAGDIVTPNGKSTK